MPRFLRGRLALVCFALTAIILHRVRGTYDGFWLPPYVLCVACFFALLSRGRDLVVDCENSLRWVVVAFLVSMIAHPGPIYWQSLAWRNAAGALIALSLAVFTMWAWHAPAIVADGKAKASRWLWAFYALHASLYIWVLRGSPAPHIDVYTIGTEAVRDLLRGVNPYTQTYADIYNGFYDYRPSFNYWPGDLLAITPAYALFREIRVTYLAAIVATAAMIGDLARRRGLSHRAAHLFAIVFLSLPVTYFVFEQAWVDPLLSLFFVGALWARERRQWLLFGTSLALLCSVKQYGVIGAGLLGLGLVADRIAGAVPRALGAFVGALWFLFIPFLRSDGPAFYRATLAHFLKMQYRSDSFSLYAWAQRALGWGAPVKLAAALTAIAALAAVTGVLTRKLSPALAAYLAYAAFFLCGKISFCNYHYLLSVLALLALLQQLRATTHSARG